MDKDNKIKIDFEKIEKESQKKEFLFFKRIQKIIFFVFLIICLILILCLGVIFPIFGISQFLSILLLVLIIFFGSLLLFFLNNFSNLQEKSLENFAKKYNFSYKESVSVFEKENYSFILKMGEKKEIQGYAQGNFKNREIEIYNFMHLVNQKSISYLVLEANTKKESPNFMIVNKNISPDFLLLLKTGFKAADFATESNEFNKNFKIFLEKNFPTEKKVEVLDILTPDLMMNLFEKRKYNLLIEFHKDKIFLFKTDNFLRELRTLFYLREKEILNLINLLFEILDELE